MNKIDKVSVLALTFLGFTQLVLTPIFHDALTQDAVWFFGSGLALVFLGFLNLARRLSQHKSILVMSAIANTIGVLFTMGIVAVYTVPQAVIALFLMVSITMATIEQLVLRDSVEHQHYA
ncbi:MAG: hypothetical protein SNJ55_09195 [Chloroherpetonaceae bacterium]